MYDWGSGIFIEYPITNRSDVTLYNNTIVNSDNAGIELDDHAAGTYRLANNLVQDAVRVQLLLPAGVTLAYSATNLSQDASSPDGAAFQNKRSRSWGPRTTT